MDIQEPKVSNDYIVRALRLAKDIERHLIELHPIIMTQCPKVSIRNHLWHINDAAKQIERCLLEINETIKKHEQR